MIEPYYHDEHSTVYCGDCRPVLRERPAASVQCVVTSPPYHGLRDYGIPPAVWGGREDCQHEWVATGEIKRGRQHLQEFGEKLGCGGGNKHSQSAEHYNASTGSFCRHCNAWRGCLGLEPTIEAYVEHVVEVFREIRRVLREDGTVWLNLGDSYAGNSTPGGGDPTVGVRNLGGNTYRKKSVPLGLKPKDLCLIPSRVALALQADGAVNPEAMRQLDSIRTALLRDFDTWDAVPQNVRSEVERLDAEWHDAHEGGWWVRSVIIWAKSNPMPESVTDRPTTAHEYIYLLSKSARYFYDADAVREPNADPHRTTFHAGKRKFSDAMITNTGDKHRGFGRTGKPLEEYAGAGRNLRTVWTIPTQPFPEAHFATFPEKLPERCIKAGTSERGCCPECGAPWVRRVVVDKARRVGPDSRGGNYGGVRKSDGTKVMGGNYEAGRQYAKVVLGFEPSCECGGEPVPCTVLDPFAGSGRTLLVAHRLGRRAVGIDVSADYCRLAEHALRERAAQRRLF